LVCYNRVFRIQAYIFHDFVEGGLKKTVVAILVIGAVCMGTVSCGNSSNSTTNASNSGFSFRAFVSNPLSPLTTGGGVPVVNIVDALHDVQSPFSISLAAYGTPGMMMEYPNKRFTLVYITSSNSVISIDNTNEAVAASGRNAIPPITLQGPSPSMLVNADNAFGYAAIPSAPVTGQASGVVQVLSLGTGTTSAVLPVPDARFVFGSHNGNRILALGNSVDPLSNTNQIAVIAPALIGTSDPRTFVSGFDHPVWVTFSSDDTTAYVFNCGAECGGTAASISVLNLNTNTVTSTIPVAGATTGFVNGTTLYVAGTPISQACGSGTAATKCGTLTTIDTGTLVASPPAVISDGYHDHIEMTSNGQLFIGATNCTNINISGGEVRGCLSIYNIGTGSVTVTPHIGDVTGIAPITNRNTVYVCQNGAFFIYDTTTDMLQTKQVDIIGQPIDVKLVD
jgi:hypothetical protein